MAVTKSKNNSMVQSPVAAYSPMLATLTQTAPTGDDWIFEVKWDGYRAISICKRKKVEIKSRNNKSFDEKFYPVHAALVKLKIDADFDGEILVLNDKGLPDFSALQQWRSEADGHLCFYVFDLLSYKGKSLLQHTLAQRREVLKNIIPQDHDIIRFSENFETTGKDFFTLVQSMNLEGIMAKHVDSKYIPGTRSKEWLKIKTSKQQEAIICGYTKNENSSKPFSALLLGLYENNTLQHIGPIGTGFSIANQKVILEKLKPYETNQCPFATIPEYNKPSRFRPNPPRASVQWVKPEVVCEISYRELTPDKALRHPSFKGIREDKNPKDIHWESAIPVPAKKQSGDLGKKVVSKGRSTNERQTLLNPSEESQERKINGHALQFSNLSKIYWPANTKFGLKKPVTKRDMINYYYQAAPFMLPYLKNKPQTLNRFPNGINGKTFYQKDVKGKAPGWIKTLPYHSETDGKDKEFLVCTNEASLLYMAGLGCMEINPWHNKINSPSNPDWCIIDLDPDKNSFDQVIEAAQVTKNILDAIGVESFCKTSGSTGIHIYIPLGAKYDYEVSKEFGRAIAKKVHAEISSFTSIERQTKNRDRKMYIDFLQNRPQATVAAPYSLRPKPGATVSMPIHWDELKKGLKMTDFNIHNSISRLLEQGDIFTGVLGKGINVDKAVIALKSL